MELAYGPVQPHKPLTTSLLKTYENQFPIMSNEKVNEKNIVLTPRTVKNGSCAIVYGSVGEVLAGFCLEKVDVSAAEAHIFGWIFGGGIEVWNNDLEIPFVIIRYPRPDVATDFLICEPNEGFGFKLSIKNLSIDSCILKWLSNIDGYDKCHDFLVKFDGLEVNDSVYYQINIIKQRPWLFDDNYYMLNNPAVEITTATLLEHYVRHGWKEGRNPSRFFSTKFYLQEYEDVRKSGQNPLVHFVKHGWSEGRKCIIDREFMQQEADISLLNDRDLVVKFRVAVVLHLFYEDLFDFMLEYISNIYIDFDLYVTTRIDLVESVQYKLTVIFPDKLINVRAVQNRGRDMAPFFVEFSDAFKDYDFVCKIHAKKSKHDSRLDNWRSHLLNNLLGSREIINTILNHFLLDDSIGIIYSVPTPFIKMVIEENSCWGVHGDNFRVSQELRERLGIESFLEDKFLFPVGSMFWFRPPAIFPLFNLGLKLEDFCEESGQIDGTLAHALERLIGLVAKKEGFLLKSAYFD